MAPEAGQRTSSFSLAARQNYVNTILSPRLRAPNLNRFSSDLTKQSSIATTQGRSDGGWLPIALEVRTILKTSSQQEKAPQYSF